MLRIQLLLIGQHISNSSCFLRFLVGVVGPSFSSPSSSSPSISCIPFFRLLLLPGILLLLPSHSSSSSSYSFTDSYLFFNILPLLPLPSPLAQPLPNFCNPFSSSSCLFSTIFHGVSYFASTFHSSYSSLFSFLPLPFPLPSSLSLVVLPRNRIQNRTYG